MLDAVAEGRVATLDDRASPAHPTLRQQAEIGAGRRPANAGENEQDVLSQ